MIIHAAKDPVGLLAVGLVEMTKCPLEYRTPTGDVRTIALRPVLDEALGTTANAATLRAALMADPGRLATLFKRLSAPCRMRWCWCSTRPRSCLPWRRRRRSLPCGTRRCDCSSGWPTCGPMSRSSFPAHRVLRPPARPPAGRPPRPDRRGDDLLRDFSKPALIEAIERPTLETSLVEGQPAPCERYGFTYADGVAAAIADGVLKLRSENQDSVLPLVQVICTRLYDQEVSDPAAVRVVTRVDLEAIGGVEGGLKAFAEEALERSMGLGPEDRDAFKAIYTRLCTRQADGTLTTWLASRAYLKEKWSGPKSFDRILVAACDVRLLREDILRIEGEEAKPCGWGTTRWPRWRRPGGRNWKSRRTAEKTGATAEKTEATPAGARAEARAGSFEEGGRAPGKDRSSPDGPDHFRPGRYAVGWSPSAV